MSRDWLADEVAIEMSNAVVSDLFVDDALRETLNMKSRGLHSRALKLSEALALLLGFAMCSVHQAAVADSAAVDGVRIENSDAVRAPRLAIGCLTVARIASSVTAR
jgi:hypothetical protein